MSKEEVSGETSHNSIFNYLMHSNTLGWESKALKFWSFHLSCCFICVMFTSCSVSCEWHFNNLLTLILDQWAINALKGSTLTFNMLIWTVAWQIFYFTWHKLGFIAASVSVRFFQSSHHFLMMLKRKVTAIIYDVTVLTYRWICFWNIQLFSHFLTYSITGSAI